MHDRLLFVYLYFCLSVASCVLCLFRFRSKKCNILSTKRLRFLAMQLSDGVTPHLRRCGHMGSFCGDRKVADSAGVVLRPHQQERRPDCIISVGALTTTTGEDRRRNVNVAGHEVGVISLAVRRNTMYAVVIAGRRNGRMIMILFSKLSFAFSRLRRLDILCGFVLQTR